MAGERSSFACGSGGADVKASENVFVTALNQDGAAEYSRVRPGYPEAAVDALLAHFPKDPGDLTAADIGAGTGKFTRLLVERGIKTFAVDPSSAMREELLRQDWAQAATESRTLVSVDATAESTGLPDSSVDMVTWVQCFHWLDQPAATREACRILRPQGVAAVIGNQLDVEVPWVHRLSRIMRSGDVMRREKPPDFGERFAAGTLVEIPWVDYVTPEDMQILARTRSSFLRSNEATREKMQGNLRWYLYDYLRFEPEVPLALPYRTFVWTAMPISSRALG